MNRLTKYFNEEPMGTNIPDGVSIEDCLATRDCPTETPKLPTLCSFCLHPLSQASFIGLSLAKPHATICNSCIKNLAVLTKLVETYNKFYFTGDFDGLRYEISRALALEEIAGKLNDAIHMQVLKLCKRSAMLFSKAPEQAAPRIAFVGADGLEVLAALEMISRAIGLPVHMTSKNDLANGLADLSNKCNRDPLLLKHGVLIVKDGYAKIDAGCAVIYCCETSADLPPNVTTIDVREKELS